MATRPLQEERKLAVIEIVNPNYEGSKLLQISLSLRFLHLEDNLYFIITHTGYKLPTAGAWIDDITGMERIVAHNIRDCLARNHSYAMSVRNYQLVYDGPVNSFFE